MENKGCANCVNQCENLKLCVGCDWAEDSILCLNIGMDIHNYFCANDVLFTSGFWKWDYRVFNHKVTEEEYKDIKKIYPKSMLDKEYKDIDEFKKEFRKIWDDMKDEDKQEYYNIPYFNWDIFEKITWVSKE